MKTYTIPGPVFQAVMNDGHPETLINAAEEYQQGSADSFVFHQHDQSVDFIDDQQQKVTARVNDFIKPVLDNQQFMGYTLVPAQQAKDWVEVTI